MFLDDELPSGRKIIKNYLGGLYPKNFLNFRYWYCIKMKFFCIFWHFLLKGTMVPFNNLQILCTLANFDVACVFFERNIQKVFFLKKNYSGFSVFVPCCRGAKKNFFWANQFLPMPRKCISYKCAFKWGYN